ncbi:MAG: hypothetical protein ACYDH9_03965 [Limisphaerales bacterium]
MSKAAKRRTCPAAGREISAAECGENRGSQYACPADCPHNPFAPASYDALLEIDDTLNAKTVDWLLADAPDPEAMKRVIQQATRGRFGHELHACIAWHLFFKRDAAGLTCAERWRRAGFPNLKNDERVLVRARMQTRVALLEVRRVLDHQRLELVDLLAPASAPILIIDRSFAAKAVRFATCLGWTFPLPHFWRLAGTAIAISDLEPFDPVEVVTELARHLGGPVTEADLRLWLAENFVRLDTALTATMHARRRKMLASIDAHFGKAVYDLRAPFEKCRAELDAEAEVADDELTPEESREGFREARVWFAKDAGRIIALPAGGRSVLGRVLLGQKQWRIEASSSARQARLRERFETRLGRKVKFVSECREDLGSRIAVKEPSVDESLVPPRLLEHPQRIELTSSRIPPLPPGKSFADYENEMRLAQNRTFPDSSIPALDGRTPREAAQDPALRPKLVRLMKARVRGHDEFNLRTGCTDDINWLLRELGLNELAFDPPPPRPRPEADEDAPEEEEGGRRVERSEPPRLPAEPLTIEQAAARLREAMAAFDTAAEAIEELDASGCTLMDDVDALTGGLLEDDEFSFLMPFLVQAWFALVPPGTWAPRVTFEDLRDAFNRTLGTLCQAVDRPPEELLKRVIDDCRQPALTQLLMLEVLQTASKFAERIQPKARMVMAIVMLVVTDAVDRALRTPSHLQG